MKHLNRDDLWSLERYAEERNAFRCRVMDHKRLRKVHVGPNLTLVFEDRLTIHYQIQEMLRAERIFDREGIQDELDAYNPLIPDGRNWKATMLIEYAEPEERKAALSRMKGIEDRVWVKVDGYPQVWAIADEDLERENEEKTSSVHFLRFELTAEMAAAVKSGASLSMGVDHDAYRHQFEVSPETRGALAADLD